MFWFLIYSSLSDSQLPQRPDFQLLKHVGWSQANWVFRSSGHNGNMQLLKLISNYFHSSRATWLISEPEVLSEFAVESLKLSKLVETTDCHNQRWPVDVHENRSYKWIVTLLESEVSFEMVFLSSASMSEAESQAGCDDFSGNPQCVYTSIQLEYTVVYCIWDY